MRYLAVLLFLKIDLTFVAPWWPRLSTDIFLFVCKRCRKCTKDNIFQISKQSNWGFGIRRFFCQTLPILTPFCPRMEPQVCRCTFLHCKWDYLHKRILPTKFGRNLTTLIFLPISAPPSGADYWRFFFFLVNKLCRPCPRKSKY